jgi:aldehyde:ferredoxin oxidoreductase
MIRRLLRVNLSGDRITEEDIPKKLAADYVGGRGFCAKYLYDEVPAGIDPLGRENKLLFVVGPLAGTNAQAFSKWIAAAKSPLTGTFSRSVGGGDFGAWLKWAGFELLILEGRAAKPAYLYIKDGKYEIRDAAPIWGKTTSQTQGYLKKEHGPRARMVCVGPAAEKLVRYAPIISGERAAGRAGMGTVMASKNLKAIVIEAEPKVILAHPEEFKKLVQQQVKLIKSAPDFDDSRQHGTIACMDRFYAAHGSIPMLNFRSGELEGWEKVSMQEYAKVTQKHVGCYACLIKCGKIRKISSGPYAGLTTEGPQFESAWAFSGSIGSTDLDATLVANYLCNELGLDTISTGVTIGFAYELFEKGILTTKDTDGLALKFGDPEPMLKLIEKIARREGIGNILAEGTKRAAGRIGKGTEQYAIQVKGLELPAYEPRARKALGMNFATANMGANHQYGWCGQETSEEAQPRAVSPVADEGSGDIVKYSQDQVAASELSVVCSFARPSLEFLGKMLVAALGNPRFGSEDYLLHIGEKAYNLERCFNVREGFDRKDDTLPMRFLTEPLQGGIRGGEMIRKQDAILDEYYAARGWDRNGIPTEETLARLGLEEVAKDIAHFRRRS